MDFLGIFNNKKEKKVKEETNKNVELVNEITLEDINTFIYDFALPECCKIDNMTTDMGYSFDLDDILNAVIAFSTGITLTCIDSLTLVQAKKIRKMIADKYNTLVDTRLQNKELGNPTEKRANELKSNLLKNMEIAIKDAEDSYVKREAFIDNGISDHLIEAFASKDYIDKLTVYMNKIVVVDWFKPINTVFKNIKIVE